MRSRSRHRRDANDLHGNSFEPYHTDDERFACNAVSWAKLAGDAQSQSTDAADIDWAANLTGLAGFAVRFVSRFQRELPSVRGW